MKHSEKMTTIAAGLLFICVVIWAFTSGATEDQSDQSVTDPSIISVDSLDLDITPVSVDWGQPGPQGGPNWIFDIFTPPVIYYNDETRTFTVTPPFPNSNPIDSLFELQLVQVQPVPYRFQLVSYAGAKGNYVLTLEDLESGKDIFCSPNETLSEHWLEVLNFIENRVIASSAREGTTEAFDLVGEVLVKDKRSGDQYRLRHNQITFTDEPKAIFETSFRESIQLSAGDTWSSPTANYSIQSIDLQGQSASVEKSLPDVGDKVVKVLHASNNRSDLSNRNTRKSETPPGAF